MIALVHALRFATWVALAAGVGSVVLLFLKRWALAHRIGKRALLLALVVFAVLFAEIQVLWSAPGLVAPFIVRDLPPGDPSSKARALAEAISEIMNCAALTIPAALLGAAGWLVGRQELKRSSPIVVE